MVLALAMVVGKPVGVRQALRERVVAALNMETPTLYIFSGLPGSGKSTLAHLLARHVGAAYLRIDTIEQTLRQLCAIEVQGEGYLLAYRVAADNLRLGTSVVADSCNPIELTRREWERVAGETGAQYVNIEVVCSDRREHRRRVETRPSTVAGLTLPTWRDVVEREYDGWTVDRVVLDTCGRSERESLAELLAKLPVSNKPLPATRAAQPNRKRAASRRGRRD